MRDPDVIVKQLKKLISISLKNESINLRIKRNRQNEREILCEELYLFEDASNDNYDFIENHVRVMNFDMIVRNDLLFEVLSSWQQCHRDIIYLSFCEHWSDLRIGKRFHMSRSSVQRIKQKLHDELRNKLAGGCNENQ